MTTRRRLVDTAAAALALGIRPASVRKLIMRGRLTRYGSPGRAKVDLEELLAYHVGGVDQGGTLSAGRSVPDPGAPTTRAPLSIRAPAPTGAPSATRPPQTPRPPTGT